MALRELFARFGVDFDREGNLARGNRQVDRTRDRVSGLTPLVDRLRNGFGALGLAIGGAAAIQQMHSFVLGTSQIGDELDKTSIQLGLTIRELQGYRLAAELSGAGTERMDNALAVLAKKIFDANAGTGEMVTLFRQLGIEYREQGGGIRNVSDVMDDLADKIAGIESPTERVGLAMRLFEEQGRFLLPMLQEGSEGMRRMRGELDELGGGMSDMAIQDSVRLRDSLTRLTVVLTTIRSKLATKLLPIMDSAVKKFQDLSTWITNTMERSHLLKGAIMAIGAILAVVAVITIATWGPIVLAVAGVTAVVGVLALAVDDLYTTAEGGESITRMIFEWIWGLEGALVAIRNMIQGVEDLRNTLATIAGFFRIDIGAEGTGRRRANIAGQEANRAIRDWLWHGDPSAAPQPQYQGIEPEDVVWGRHARGIRPGAEVGGRQRLRRERRGRELGEEYFEEAFPELVSEEVLPMSHPERTYPERTVAEAPKTYRSVQTADLLSGRVLPESVPAQQERTVAEAPKTYRSVQTADLLSGRVLPRVIPESVPAQQDNRTINIDAPTNVDVRLTGTTLDEPTVQRIVDNSIRQADEARNRDLETLTREIP